MIIAIGTDAIEIERIRRAVDHPRWGERFRQRVFTAGEIAYCLKRARAGRVGARPAAEVARLKAPAPAAARRQARHRGRAHLGAAAVMLPVAHERAMAIGATRWHLC
jgi:holo-[acyl-carrier protein] synthase